MAAGRRISGVSHTTFIVRALDRTAVFLCEGPGARETYDSAGGDFSRSREKFFLLGDTWLTAMEGEPPAVRSYQHIAFKVEAAAIPKFEARPRALGVDIERGRSRVAGEGGSLYFHDVDNHLFETHAGTPGEHLERYGAAT